MVMICPFVMSWAMPRPATIRTSVAIIGWILARETNSPFHRPHSVPAARQTSTMMGSGVLVASLVRMSLVIRLIAQRRINQHGGQRRRDGDHGAHR